LVVGDQVVNHIAVFRLPSGVTVLGNDLVDLAESLDQLTSLVVVGEVQKVARNGSGLGQVTLGLCSGENSLSKVLEFGKKSLGVSLRKCWIGSPLHFLHELVEVAPLESHQRAHTLAEVGVHVDVGTRVVGERTFNWLAKIGVRACTTIVVVRASAASISVARDTVTKEAVLAGTLETAGGVLASGIGMAVVSALALLVDLALVEVNAFAASLVVPVANGASTFAKSAGSSSWAVLVAFFGDGADESISFVAVGAFACVRISISVGNAVRVGTAFAAWILSDFLADAVVAGLVVAAVNVVAWIGGDAFAIFVLVAIWALAHALVVTVGVSVSEGVFATSAGGISAWIDVHVANVAISLVAIFADAVVVLFAGDLSVWNAVSVVVAVVVLARIDWVANEAVTSVASLASADVVVNVADEARVAAGVLVAASSVDCARINLNAFCSFLNVSIVADALVSISSCECVTGGVEWANAGVRAVVDWITVFFSITVVMSLADALVSDRSVDALGILVAFVLVGVEALVDWADKGVVVKSKPLFPFGLVKSVAFVENVVEKSLNSIVKILRVDDVLKVEKLTWDGSSINSAFGTVSLRSRRVVAQSGSVFLLVRFAEVEHFFGEEGESRGGVVLLADLDSSGVDFGVQIGPAWSGVFQRAKTVVKVTLVTILKVSFRADKWWPAALDWVAKETFFAFAGVSGVGVDAVGGERVAGMGTLVAFISWTCAVFTISNVALLAAALAVVAVVGVVAISVGVALVQVRIEALVDGNGALVTVANVVVVANALVSGVDVDAGGVFVALVRVVLTLVDLRHAVLSVAVEAFLALALEAGVLLTVDSSFWNAISIRVAVGSSVFAIVGLIAGRFSQLIELIEIEYLPFIIALCLDLVDDSLESMDPFASGGVSGVIDPLAANNTGVG